MRLFTPLAFLAMQPKKPSRRALAQDRFFASVGERGADLIEEMPQERSEPLLSRVRPARRRTKGRGNGCRNRL